MKGYFSALNVFSGIVILILMLINLSLKAQDAEQQHFINGNKAYANKQYELSIEHYSKILAMGKENPVLFYNMGNSWFRLKNYPRAILYYEKSLKSDPGNEDARFNLDIANSRIVDKIEVVPAIFYERWWNSFLNFFSINAFAILTIISSTFSMIFWGIYLMNSRKGIRLFSSWTAGILLLIFILFWLAADSKKSELNNYSAAIVITPTLNVKSSPDESSKDVFVIHEGTKVMLLDTIADWQEIKIANGNIGWIRKSDIEKI